MTNDKIQLHTFKVPEDIDLRLSNRADSDKAGKADLARSFLDELLANADLIHGSQSSTDRPMVLRSYYLTQQQAAKLREVATLLDMTEGDIFRIALIKGLGAVPLADKPAYTPKTYTLAEFVAQAKDDLDGYLHDWTVEEHNQFHDGKHTWGEWWQAFKGYYSWEER